MMLKSDKVVLRALEPTDIDKIVEWENDSRLWGSTSTVAPFSRMQVWNYIQQYKADPLTEGQLRLMVADAATGQSVGMVDITDVDALNRRAQVGIMIDPEHWRKGFALEALRLMAEYSRQRLGFHQLWAVVRADNEASRALFESAGYSITGRLRSWIRTGEMYSDAYLVYRFL